MGHPERSNLGPMRGTTRLVPILAHPVDHVIAAAFYDPAFAAAGLDWRLVPMGVAPDDFAATLEQLARVTNLQGVVVTMPHKRPAHAACARVGDEARRTGVVNTLRLGDDGAWEGESSDGAGFVGAARAAGVLDPARPVAIAGAGGAGRAIAFALASEGVRELRLHDVEPGRADQLAADVSRAYPRIACRVGLHLRGARLAVNATPVGLHAGDAPPFDPTHLDAGCAVFDIIARETELMARARAQGGAVVGGERMIEHQIAVQIEFWRGGAAPKDLQP